MPISEVNKCLNIIARKYKEMVILAVAAVAIAIPFNSGSVRAQNENPPLDQEYLIDLLGADQARTNQRLQEAIDENPGQEDRIVDRRVLSDERYDIGRQHVGDQTGGQ